MSIWTKNADYLEQVLPEYRWNPLIEALPEIMSKEDTLACLTREPDHDEGERNLIDLLCSHVLWYNDLVKKMRMPQKFQMNLTLLVNC